MPSWRLRGVRVDAGVATTVADVWARAASVSGKKRGLIPSRGIEPATCRARARAADQWADRKSTRLNSSHSGESRMPSSA